MTALSGKNGTLKLAGSLVTPITDWNLELTCATKAYIANDTHGAAKRVVAGDDCAGAFHCRISGSGRCPVQRGDEAAAEFHVDSTGGNYYAVPIIIDRIGVRCDMSTGAALAFEVHFSGNGPVVEYGILAKSR
jgi:hypothetical protein